MGTLRNIDKFVNLVMKEKNMLGYKKEMGAIISPQGHALHYVEGLPGEVTFPAREVAWKLHMLEKGSVYKYAHVHPPAMAEPSDRDRRMAKAWAVAFYPFPARISVVTYVSPEVIKETTYFVQWNIGKDLPEGTKKHTSFIEKQEWFTQETAPEWMDFLLKEAYSDAT